MRASPSLATAICVPAAFQAMAWTLAGWRSNSFTRLVSFLAAKRFWLSEIL
jgi:hypothetical protein